MYRKYIMVLDERGTTRWPSRTKTWAVGGFIVNFRHRERIVRVWDDIKRQLCGTSSCELKWSHFFPGHHQDGGTNPLLSDDPKLWREQVSWAVGKILEEPIIQHINCRVRKDRASDAVFRPVDETDEKPYRVLDIDTLWVPIYAQFILVLRERRAKGEIWFDKLGSRAEEERRQTDWLRLRNEPWTVKPDNRKELQRISPKFRFFDSKTNGLVQVADFISGVIWAASEGDEKFLLEALDKYFPTGPNTVTFATIV